MADESLLQLAKGVRAKTLRILDGVSEEQAKWLPPGLHNHILWHAGHPIIVVEHYAVQPITGKSPEYPAGWAEKFGGKSDPKTVAEWPKVAAVREQLVGQLDRVLAAIGLVSPERLDQPAKPGDARTLRGSILLALQDEAGHQGEMYLMKKLQTRL